MACSPPPFGFPTRNGVIFVEDPRLENVVEECIGIIQQIEEAKRAAQEEV